MCSVHASQLLLLDADLHLRRDVTMHDVRQRTLPRQFCPTERRRHVPDVHAGYELRDYADLRVGIRLQVHHMSDRLLQDRGHGRHLHGLHGDFRMRGCSHVHERIQFSV